MDMTLTISIGCAVVVIGAFWRLATTLTRIETKLDIYINNQAKLEERVRKLEDKIRA